MKGASEIGFTVLGMSLAHCSIIPILMMGGIVGRLFREFAVVLSVAMAMSMPVSLDRYADDVRTAVEAGAKHGGSYNLNREVLPVGFLHLRLGA